MLGFKKEYGFGGNAATVMMYVAAIDFIQAQFTGRYISEHLGTKITDIPCWIGDAGIFLSTAISRHIFIKNKREEGINLRPLEKLDDLK